MSGWQVGGFFLRGVRPRRNSNRSLRSVSTCLERQDRRFPGILISGDVGNITVSNNDAVAGINPGTTPWSTTGERASVNLSTGHVSFEVEGLVLNGGNATGTRAGVDQVEGSLICDAGQQDQTIFPTLPVPLDARGNAEFSGTFDAPPATCNNPLFLIRIGPDLPGANQRWIATAAVRSFGGSDGHN